MVFTSIVNFIRARGPDRVWNRRRVFFMSAAFRGRKRQCFSVAIRSVHRALQFNRLSRPLKKIDMANLWEARISAGCEQHGIAYRWFHEGLSKAGVHLNRKVLADLAVWEPRTFESLTKLASQSIHDDGRAGLAGLHDPPKGVITRSMLHSPKKSS